MFFCFVLGRKPSCPKLNVRRCYVVKYCYRYLRICRCVPLKKYGDETGFDKQLNDEMFETPGDEAESLEEPSKSIAIPVHSSKWFSKNKAPLLPSRVHVIDHFTVVGLATWPLNGSEVGGDLVLILTSLLLCKSTCSYVNQFAFTWEKQRGLYQSKVTSSLARIRGQVTKHTT